MKFLKKLQHESQTHPARLALIKQTVKKKKKKAIKRLKQKTPYLTTRLDFLI